MRERLCDTLMRMAGRLPEWEPLPKAPDGALRPPGPRPDPRIYPKTPLYRHKRMTTKSCNQLQLPS